MFMIVAVILEKMQWILAQKAGSLDQGDMGSGSKNNLQWPSQLERSKRESQACRVRNLVPHEHVAAQMNQLLKGGTHTDWLTQVRAVLMLKVSPEGGESIQQSANSLEASVKHYSGQHK